MVEIKAVKARCVMDIFIDNNENKRIFCKTNQQKLVGWGDDRVLGKTKWS